MATTSDFYTEIRRNCRGVTNPSMDAAILRAAREFCRETWFIRRTQVISTSAKLAQYDIVSPVNEETIALKHAQLTDADGKTAPLRFGYQTYANPNLTDGRPSQLYFVPYTSLTLAPPPDGVYQLTIELITQPRHSGVYIPDELLTGWDQALGNGALAWLMLQAQNPWANAALAQQNKVMFDQAIVAGRRQAAFDFTPNQQVWVNPGFLHRGRF